MLAKLLKLIILKVNWMNQLIQISNYKNQINNYKNQFNK